MAFRMYVARYTHENESNALRRPLSQLSPNREWTRRNDLTKTLKK